MEYEVTEERKAYLDARGYTILSACPGSGKTTSIVKKLYDISAYCKQQYGTHTGFACLSFTNKACGELKSKYVEMHRESLLHPNVVSTIDSFIMQYVILPFWYLCDFCKSKPIVVNEKEILSKVYLNHVMVNGKMNEYKVMALRPYNDLFYKYPPETVRRKYRGFCFGNGPIVTDEKENNYCEAAFNHRLSKGIITSQDALWIAFYIISKHKHIAEIIISRFPYIIVDEAQDNSYLQFAFFEKLKQAGLKNLEYVGDICQSIYGFRNAYPKALQSLMKNKEWNTLHFTECRRSNQRIIDLYSKLKPSFIPQIKSHNVDDKNINNDPKKGIISSIIQMKTVKNFIEVKTEAVSNEIAIAKSKEILDYAQKLYEPKIEQYKTLVNNDISNIEDEIKFLKNEKMKMLTDKVESSKANLEKYNQEINSLYKSNTNANDKISSMIVSVQMVNYQNLIENAQNVLKTSSLEIEQILKDTIPKLQQKKEVIKFKTSEQNLTNTRLVGNYVTSEYPAKPKKVLIIVVAFVTGFVLSIFAVFFMQFVSSVRKG